MRKPKRSLDLRKIRQSRCYTVQEVSNLLGVTKGTVRSWLKLGLPYLPDGKPFLVPGDSLKTWLVVRRRSRKRRCLPDELYCCRCRMPRLAIPGSVGITIRNAKTVTIHATCACCGSKMNKGGSHAELENTKVCFGLKTRDQVNLEGCENPAVNHHLESEPDE